MGTLLEDVDEAKAEAIIKEFASTNNDQDDAESRWGFNLGFKWDKLVDTLLEDVDEAKAEAIINKLASSNNAESRGFWTNLLMKLVSDKDDAESRWGLSFGFGFDKLTDALLEDVDEAKAEAIIKEFASKNSNAESRGFWTNLLITGCFGYDKFDAFMLKDVDDAKAEAIIKKFVTKSSDAESRGFWTNLLMKLVSDQDDAESRGLWTNFKQCLLDKDDSLSRGIWSSFKSCLKDQDIAESRGFWTNLLMKLVSDHDDEA